jgi:hypothetical protein
LMLCRIMLTSKQHYTAKWKSSADRKH